MPLVFLSSKNTVPYNTDRSRFLCGTVDHLTFVSRCVSSKWVHNMGVFGTSGIKGSLRNSKSNCQPVVWLSWLVCCHCWPLLTTHWVSLSKNLIIKQNTDSWQHLKFQTYLVSTLRWTWLDIYGCGTSFKSRDSLSRVCNLVWNNWHYFCKIFENFEFLTERRSSWGQYIFVL